MMYRLDIGCPINQIAFTQSDTLLLYSKNVIQMWHLNRFFHQFSFSNVQPQMLLRYAMPDGKPARLLAGYVDGSLRLLSPVTGEALIVGFPIYKDAALVGLEYDASSDLIYARNSNRDILVYSTKTNPMKVVEVWEPQTGWEQIHCFKGIHFVPDPPYMAIEENEEEASERKREFESSFFLVAGAENGQLLNLRKHHKGEQESIIQAHAAPISSLEYDSVGFSLITGAKVAGESTCPLYLQCTAALTLCQVNDPRFENPMLNHTFTVNPFTKTIAFPWNGRLSIVSYEKDADINGSVKIWNNKGSFFGTMQEAMFNQSISCIQFANLRGDLLVGLKDQVVAIYMQTYFTVALMKTALEKSKRLIDVQIQDEHGQTRTVQQYIDEEMETEYFNDANGFEDDVAERALIFDSNSDFWSIFYDQQKELYGDAGLRWHVSKDLIPTDLGEKMEKDLEFWRPWKLIMKKLKRRNRRLFLSKEANAFKAASEFDDKFFLSKRNAAHSKNGCPAPKKVEETPEIVLGGDYIFIQRVDSNDAILETGLDISTPKLELLENHPRHPGWQTVKDNLVVGSRLGPILQAVISQKQKKNKEIAQNMLINPNANKRKVNLYDVVQKREELKRNLRKAGTAIPNSVIAEKPKEVTSAPAKALRASIKKYHSIGQTKQVGNRKPSSKPEWWFDNEEEELEETPTSQNAEGLLVPTGKNIRKLSLTVKYESSRKPSIREPSVHEPESLQSSRKPSVAHASGSNLNVSAPTRRASFVDVVLAVKEGKEPDEIPSAKLQPKKDIEKTFLFTSPIHHQGQFPQQSQVPEIPISLPIKSKPCAPAPPPQMPKEQPRQSLQYIVLPGGKFDSDIASTSEESQLDDLNGVSQEEAEAYAWNLLRMRQGFGIPRALRKIVKQFWFKSPENDPLDLEHVIKALVQLMYHGEWSECCEASKALVFIYITFKNDIPDPYPIFLVPHLDVLDSNPSWQVRAQICSNLSAFRHPHRAVFYSLIMRLNDTHQTVRVTAKQALMNYGINSRMQLLELMKVAGLLPQETVKNEPSLMDIMKRDSGKEQIALAAESTKSVFLWQEDLKAENCPGYHGETREHKRRQSYEEHLAGPFFKDKKTHFMVPPIRQTTIYDVKHEDIKDDISSWMEAEGMSATTTATSVKYHHSQRQGSGKHDKRYQWNEEVIQSLVHGRPTSGGTTLVASSRPVSGALSAAMKMARPISAGLRAMVALDYRRTTRPTSGRLDKVEIVRFPARPSSAATSVMLTPHLEPYLSTVPYCQSSSFLKHKTKLRTLEIEESRTPWH
ncbi:hypothetical protein BDR26DRAFT_881270 [Obelidium mucronatum]|nr:hypothetical protein BDR26DRAFT_881270 [Obelidium mucronatum]